MKEARYRSPENLPWETEEQEVTNSPDNAVLCVEHDPGYEQGIEGPTFNSIEVYHLLDQMIMDIQHLELEIIRSRYKLSFYLSPPYDEYLRMEIFSGMGTRYGGDPVYDKYLSYCGLDVDMDEDAIDTEFHLARKYRLASGHDDFPDLYP